MPFGFAPTDPIIPAVAWAARALTFFNVLVLLWLGLTVLLNAERRQVGAWLTGGGLLLGGLCSILRAAALSGQLSLAVEQDGPPDLWWRTSWLPFAGAAYLWCVVLAWYSGRLRSTPDRLGMAGLSLLGFWTFVLLLTARPPEHLPDEALALSGLPIAAMPNDGFLALTAFLAFSGLCVLHGLRALYQPQNRDRFMGELAARRARPWLTATSLVTLGFSLIVGLGVTGAPVLTPWTLVDLLGALLLAAHVVLLGQAIVSYEVFTGKTLPRRGLARYWRNALILAAGFGGLLAVSLGLPLDQSYRLTLALVAVAVFYALLSWRSFVERERSLEQLRPFVASEHLFERLLASERTEEQPSSPLSALCRDLLGASVGYLFPVGPLAPLVGGPISAPPEATPPDPSVLAQLTARITSARQLCLPIEAAQHAGAAWMIPLWGERGLIGLLLLGEKRDGSLYTQEEIEIARAAGERLVDARAARELARRLLVLQRKRLADDHLQDARVRRALHDDVLPLLHTALLALNAPASDAASAATPSAAALLADAHRLIAGLLADLPPMLTLDPARGGLFGALRRLTDDLGADLDGVEWRVNEASEQALAVLPPLSAEVLFGSAREAIRNVVRHGRADDATRPLHLWVTVTVDGDDLAVRIQDDGVGLAGAPSQAGAGTPGSGQGLLLHSTLLTVLGGALTTESAPGQGTRVTLRVPR